MKNLLSLMSLILFTSNAIAEPLEQTIKRERQERSKQTSKARKVKRLNSSSNS